MTIEMIMQAHDRNETLEESLGLTKHSFSTLFEFTLIPASQPARPGREDAVSTLLAFKLPDLVDAVALESINKDEKCRACHRGRQSKTKN